MLKAAKSAIYVAALAIWSHKDPNIWTSEQKERVEKKEYAQQRTILLPIRTTTCIGEVILADDAGAS